jgi:hypothetical protein
MLGWLLVLEAATVAAGWVVFGALNTRGHYLLEAKSLWL